MDNISREKIDISERMISGLNGNKNRLSRRGLDDDFIGRYCQTVSNIKELDRELKDLNILLEEKNDRLEKALSDLNKFYVVTMKIVKLDLPEKKWIEFGIQKSNGSTGSPTGL